MTGGPPASRTACRAARMIARYSANSSEVASASGRTVSGRFATGWAFQQVGRDVDGPAQLLDADPGRGQLVEAPLDVGQGIIRPSLFGGLDCRLDPWAVCPVPAQERELKDQTAVPPWDLAGGTALLWAEETVVDFPGFPPPNFVVGVET